LTASLTSGTLATGTVYVKYTFTDGTGNETAASPEASVAVTGPTASVAVSGIVLPIGARGIKVYVSSTTNTELFAASSVNGTATYTITAVPGSGAVAPAVNGTGAGGAITVWVFLVPPGGVADMTNVFLPKWPIDDGGIFVNGYSTILAAGTTIQVGASAKGCTITASGVEVA
jgi:hypothetical protein